MSRFSLVGKEVYELVLERRFLLTLTLVSAVLSLIFVSLLAQSTWSPASPMEFLMVGEHVGPALVGLLAITLAGDAVARERQDRTIDLLFTAPATQTRYWAALLVAHGLAFLIFSSLLVLFSVLVGWAMGWVAVKGMAFLLIISLLPLFLTLDFLVLSVSARLANGRTSLLLAVVVVLGLLFTSSIGPFGWVLQGTPGWHLVSIWHPFDLAGASARALLEQGTIVWEPMLKAWLEVLLAAALAWTSIATREAGR